MNAPSPPDWRTACMCCSQTTEPTDVSVDPMRMYRVCTNAECEAFDGFQVPSDPNNPGPRYDDNGCQIPDDEDEEATT